MRIILLPLNICTMLCAVLCETLLPTVKNWDRKIILFNNLFETTTPVEFTEQVCSTFKSLINCCMLCN